MFENKTPLGDCAFVAFDTETTGTGAGTRLVEIAGSRFSRGELAGTFATLVDPEQPIPPEVIEVHQITDSMVKGQPKARDALRDFFAFAEGAILVAHNAAFDAGIIGLEIARARTAAPANPLVDSLKAARRIYPGPQHSLDALIDRVGLPPQDARHRALADAELVRHLVARMIEALGGASAPLGKLYEQAGRPQTLADFMPKPARLTPTQQFLEQACREGLKVSLQVDAGGARPQQRIVSPKLCYDWNGTGFLEAFCPDDGYVRCFRLDKIVKAERGASSGSLF